MSDAETAHEPDSEPTEPAGGKDRREDYGNAPGVDGKEQVRAPDDIEDRVRDAGSRESIVRVEQNPGRDR